MNEMALTALIWAAALPVIYALIRLVESIKGTRDERGQPVGRTACPHCGESHYVRFVAWTRPGNEAWVCLTCRQVYVRLTDREDPPEDAEYIISDEEKLLHA